MSRSFPDRVKKLVLYFDLQESSLDLQRREEQINTTYEKEIYFSTCGQSDAPSLSAV